MSTKSAFVAVAIALAVPSIHAHVGRVLSDAHVGRVLSDAHVGRVLSDPPASRVQKYPAYQAAQTAKPVQPAGKIDAGGVLYKKVGCYQCHANEAQGGLSGPRIGPNLFPFARFSEYIRKPTGEMPPYTPKVLSDQDVADIYAWVQARPRPPAVNSIPQLAP